MKKTNRKLRLNGMVVRVLDAAALEAARAGMGPSGGHEACTDATKVPQYCQWPRP